MPEIQTRERDGVVLLDATGNLAGDAAALSDRVAECLARGRNGVVLNLQDATYIDSTWLGAIVQGFTKLSQAGGQLKLVHVPTKLMYPLSASSNGRSKTVAGRSRLASRSGVGARDPRRGAAK
jgi:anti-anti-sigma factor